MLPSKFSILEFVPQPLGNALAITFQPVTRRIVADVFDIAGEQGESVGIETRVDGRCHPEFCVKISKEELSIF